MDQHRDVIWSEDECVARLLQLLPDEAAREAVRARRADVAQLFRDAYADGVENGILAARAADPLL
ncbi:hypothetical protein [Aureimonas sp. Leaf324]|jgi:hypothetical protein|uniref:hypothetical protein n=1 Tax=Aureimonas sp. Leaf324 TaxID=1736336 RepID=UPI0006FAA258|nr:hypothetical protein [Aureimonas sp. Leaf324]KQQ81277.1 hypothetical protein ASF65_09770 [Aureimonas sp. Leaf324]